jgi:sec-independent protein translocase protein TatB
MFDLTSSKLLLLAVVALLVIGPKDFPVLLRTIGKYMGIIRGHAKEFRAQFDEAMRESELGQLKKDMESIAQETEASLSTTSKSVQDTFSDARLDVEGALADAPPASTPVAAPDPLAHDVAATGETAVASSTAPAEPAPTPAISETASPAAIPETATEEAAPAETPVSHTASTTGPVPERTGA